MDQFCQILNIFPTIYLVIDAGHMPFFSVSNALVTLSPSTPPTPGVSWTLEAICYFFHAV